MIGYPNNAVDRLIRQCVDSGAHAAVSRFKDRLGDTDEGTASRMARAAAEIAVEQFRCYVNNELSLIRADQEARFNEAVLRMPEPLIATKL